MKLFYLNYYLLVLLIPLRNIVLKTQWIDYAIGVNLINILYGVTFLGALVSVKKNGQDYHKRSLFVPLLLNIIYYIIVSFLVPSHNNLSTDLIIIKDTYFFMLVLYAFTSSHITSNKLIYILFFSICLASFYMDTYFWRWVRWMNFSSFSDKMKTVNGTFADYGGCNEWAAFFSTYTLIIISIIPSITHKIYKFIIVILAISNIVVLLFTFSRGSYLGFIIGLLFLLIAKRKFITIILLCLIPIFYTSILPQSVIERVSMSYETNDYGDIEDQDINSRLMMWDYAMVMIKDSPIIGHGFNSFHFKHWNNPHNQHIYVLVQGGIIGYILFLFLFYYSFNESYTLWRIGLGKFERLFGLGMAAATISLFVSNIFGDRWSYYVLNGYFWIFNGVVCVYLNRSRAKMISN